MTKFQMRKSPRRKIMISDDIVYFPYKTTSAGAIISMIVSIFMACFAGICISQNNFVLALIWFLLSCIMVSITKILYDLSKIVFLFTQDCIKISGLKYMFEYSISWQELRYAYYMKNSRGYPHWILSVNQMTPQECRKLINSTLGFAKAIRNDVILIFCHVLEDVSAIEEIIDNKVGYRENL